MDVSEDCYGHGGSRIMNRLHICYHVCSLLSQHKMCDISCLLSDTFECDQIHWYPSYFNRTQHS